MLKSIHFGSTKTYQLMVIINSASRYCCNGFILNCNCRRVMSDSVPIDAVKYLIEQGADIHVDNDYPLIWASKMDQCKLVKYLVENGADIHARDDEALIWASKMGQCELVKYLI